jgi:hypothetical protein
MLGAGLTGTVSRDTKLSRFRLKYATTPMPNKPNAIIIYRHDGGWAFNDERYGLVAEALIEGADTLVHRIVAPMRNPTLQPA